jgi:hypothetical protein
MADIPTWAEYEAADGDGKAAIVARWAAIADDPRTSMDDFTVALGRLSKTRVRRKPKRDKDDIRWDYDHDFHGSISNGDMNA